MALTDTKIKNTKATGKPFKLYDGNGLYLHFSKTVITTRGKEKGRAWRYKYRFNDKEKSLTIGQYPSISLKEAREIRNSAYVQVAGGIDPAQKKQDRKSEKEKRELEELAKIPVGKTFKEVALAWADFKARPNTKRNWKFSHKKAVINSLSREAFPFIGDRIIHTLTSDDVDAVIDPIQSRGALEVSERTLHRIGAIFRYGRFKKWCDSNPALGRDEFLERREKKHMKHLEEKDLPKFLRDLDNYQGNFVCKSAIQFVLLTYARTNEIRFAEWDEIDFESKQWNIPAERMKMGISQTIPLCSQAIELLESIKPITGSSKFIFASMIAMHKPISENGMLSALYNMGYKGKTTIHGLRGTYSTIANETLKFRRDVIEAALAHKVDDPVRESYCHATYLDERTENAQTWGNYLDQIKQGADVIPIRKQS